MGTTVRKQVQEEAAAACVTMTVMKTRAETIQPLRKHNNNCVSIDYVFLKLSQGILMSSASRLLQMKPAYFISFNHE